MAVTKIKRIPPVPIAMAVGLVYGVLGLIFGILNAISVAFNYSALVSLVQRLTGLSGTTLEIGLLSPINVGIGLIIGYPMGGFVIGFLGTLLVISVYNVVAKKNPIHIETR